MKPSLLGYSSTICHPNALTPEDARAWNALRAAHSDYNSPLFSPEFVQTVGQNRTDARIVLFHDGMGLAGVFAYFRRPDRVGRSIGAPFSDYSGPVLRADFRISLTEILEAAGLAAWGSASLVDPWDHFVEERFEPHQTMMIRLEVDPAEYLEAQRKQHPKRFKNFRRLDSQAARDGHELCTRWGRLHETLKTQLFSLKSQQYVASGLVDLTDAKYARQILENVADSPFGYCISLWSGDAFVSGHFGFRLDDVFHPWIAAYNPEFARYSPGNLLLKRIIEHMPEMGLVEYDLAEGHDHYKKYYISDERRVYHVFQTSRTVMGRVKAASATLWQLLGGQAEVSPVKRLRRRLDHVAASDPRFMVRVRDLLSAMQQRGINRPAGPHSKSGPE